MPLHSQVLVASVLLSLFTTVAVGCLSGCTPREMFTGDALDVYPDTSVSPFDGGSTPDTSCTSNEGQWLPKALPIVAKTRLRLLAVGDFNGDGKYDLLVAADKDGAEEIWKYYPGDGSGGFAAPLDLPAFADRDVVTASVDPFFVGDFDGDGVDDLLMNLSSDVAILAGHKVAESALKKQSLLFSVSDWPQAAMNGQLTAVPIDHDGDGLLDLVFEYCDGGSAGSLCVAANVSQPERISFGDIAVLPVNQPPFPVPEPGWYGTIAGIIGTADLNRDSRAEPLFTVVALGDGGATRTIGLYGVFGTSTNFNSTLFKTEDKVIRASGGGDQILVAFVEDSFHLVVKYYCLSQIGLVFDKPTTYAPIPCSVYNPGGNGVGGNHVDYHLRGVAAGYFSSGLDEQTAMSFASSTESLPTKITILNREGQVVHEITETTCAVMIPHDIGLTVASDLDGDGWHDLVFTDNDHGMVRILLNRLHTAIVP